MGSPTLYCSGDLGAEVPITAESRDVCREAQYGCQDADIIFTHPVAEVCHAQHIHINVGICYSGKMLHSFSVRVEEGQGLY